MKLVDYTGRDVDLEADPNPFAAVTLAHLKAQETRGDPTARYDWKLRLVKGLYDRGFTRERIVRLFRVIDWVMKYPPILRRQLVHAVDEFEKERQMPVLSPTEQMWQDDGIAMGLAKGLAEGQASGRAVGLADGLEAVLDLRFGAEGLALMPRIRRITDPAVLEQLLRAGRSVPDVGAFRALLPPEA